MRQTRTPELRPRCDTANDCDDRLYPQSTNGIALPNAGSFNPKRLITIYDGPFYADGNIFLNIDPFLPAIQA